MNKHLLQKNICLICILLLSCVILSACSNYNDISDKVAKYQFLYSKKQAMLNEYSGFFNDTNKNSEQITKMDQQIYEITRQLYDLEKDPKVKEYAKSLEIEQSNDNIYKADIYDDLSDPKGFDTISSSSEIQNFDSIEFNSTDLSYENSGDDLNTGFESNKDDSDYDTITDEYKNNTGEISNKLDDSITETDSENTFEDVVNEDDYKETI